MFPTIIFSMVAIVAMVALEYQALGSDTTMKARIQVDLELVEWMG